MKAGSVYTLCDEDIKSYIQFQTNSVFFVTNGSFFQTEKLQISLTDAHTYLIMLLCTRYQVQFTLRAIRVSALFEIYLN